VLETFPRDELFQIFEDELIETALGILRLQERPRIRLFVRRDRFERFCSCLTYLPRELYGMRLRERILDILAAAFEGTVSAFYTQLGDSNLARLHIIVRTTPERMPNPDLGRVEALIVQAARSWDDDLRDVLIERQGEEAGNRLRDVYRDAFPTAYKETFSAAEAVADIHKIEEVAGAAPMASSMYRPIEAPADTVRFKIYHPTDPIRLSDCLPIFEKLGLKVIEERPYRIRRRGEPAVVWTQDFLLIHPAGAEFDPAPIKENFQEAFARVWHGEAEDDGFNRLVFGTGLNWREVTIVRAY
jgi:glutamate dehydrogenase